MGTTIIDPHMAAVVLLAQGQGGGRGMDLWSILPLIVIGVLFYLMLLRPDRKRRSEHETMLQNLKKNDHIVTIGGIHGTVVNINSSNDEVTIRVDDNNNTRLRISRSAVARVAGDENKSEGSETKELG